MKKLKPKLYRVHAFVCHGGKCSRAGAAEIRSGLRKVVKTQGSEVRVSRTLCQGYCKHACVVFAEGKASRWWAKVEPGDVPKLAKKLTEMSKMTSDVVPANCPKSQ